MIIKTAGKIFIARILFALIMTLRRLCGLLPVVKAARSGIQWNLDLREGIDLSIYLLGSFEPTTQKLYKRLIRSGAVVLDIGANIGSHSLPLAKLVGNEGKVVAFEPTRFAVEKLNKNIQLNPELANRIIVKQQLLVGNAQQLLSESIYSSWPLGPRSDELHLVHKGKLMKTTGAIAITLDESLRELGVDRVDFVKLDVDGNEYSVIKGGWNTLEKFKPNLLMEIAPYLFREQPEDLEGILSMFRKMEYSVFDTVSMRELPLSALGLFRLIPQGSSLNIIALARTRKVISG